MEAKRSALIIATDEYHDARLRRLRAPARDAEELGRVLAEDAIGGFDVEILHNEPEYKVRRKLAQFFADRNRDDLLLVHFSCHGLKDDDGTLYFATPDTEMDQLDSTAVPSDFVNRQMHRSRSRRIALFLDCCYSGAFSRGAMARAGDGVELAERFDGQGQVVITASNAMEYAFEGDELTGAGTPSVFTTAIVEGLESGEADRDGDDLVSIDELYEYVYDRVREQTPGQTPSKWAYDLQGDLYVAKNPRPRPITPAELPSELRDVLESPLTAVRLGAVTELERIMVGASARLASAARVALDAMREDDSRSVSTAAAEALARAGELAEEEVAKRVAPAPRVSGANQSTTYRASAPRVVSSRPRSASRLHSATHVVLGRPAPLGSPPAWWRSGWPAPRGLVLRLGLVGAALLLWNYISVAEGEEIFAGVWYGLGLSIAVAFAAVLVRLGDAEAAVSVGALLAFGVLTALAPETLQRLYGTPPVPVMAAIAAVLASGLLGLATVAGVGRAWRRPLRGQAKGILAAPLLALGGCALWVFALLLPYAGGNESWDHATLREHFYTEGALRLGAVAVVGSAAGGLLVPVLTSRYRLLVAGALAAAGIQTALYFLGLRRGVAGYGGNVLEGTWIGLGAGVVLLAAGIVAYRTALRPEPAEEASGAPSTATP